MAVALPDRGNSHADRLGDRVFVTRPSKRTTVARSFGGGFPPFFFARRTASWLWQSAGNNAEP